MRSFLLVAALLVPTLPAFAEDTAAVQTDPVLKVQAARSHLDTLRARLGTMRKKGEGWQGRFDLNMGLAGGGKAAFRPIFNPPTGQESAPALKAAGAGLQAAAAGLKALNLQGKAGAAVVQLESALADLAAADGPLAGEAALNRVQAALDIVSPR